MMLSSVATFFEVGKDGMCIDQWHLTFLSLAHNADAPVDICRMAILQIVRELTGYLRTDIESLMAHQHTLFEGLPSKRLWWTMGTQMQEVALFIRDSRIAVDNSRKTAVRSTDNNRDGVWCIKRIASIEEYQIVARSLLQAFVHGIIEATVRL